MTVGLCYDVSISKIHLQERCKMEMLYAICDAATGPLIETDHIFGIVVADSQEVAPKNEENPNGVIANWMRNRNTIEFLGIWECLYNPSFKPLEFERFRKEAGLNAITLSPNNVFNNPSFLVYNIACEFRDLHDRSDVKCKERKV